MNKLMKTAIATAVTGLLVSPLAMADPVPVESTLQVDAVINDLELTVAVTPLDFGAIWVPGDGGTVVIAAEDGDRLVTGDIIEDGGNEGGQGVFTLTGGVHDGVAGFEFGNTSVTLEHVDDPAITMTADTFTIFSTSTLTGSATNGTVQLDENGAAVFHIGGTLDVDDNQPSGTYQGEVTVTFDY